MRHCAYFKHKITNFEEKMSQKNNKDILDDVKDAFNDNDGKKAIELLMKEGLKMRASDIETANFTQMSVSSRLDFWKNCCVERDEIIRDTTPEQIEKFKKECDALKRQAHEYFDQVRPHFQTFIDTVTGGEIFIKGIDVAPVAIFPDLDHFLEQNDFGELLDAYYQYLIHFREFAFLMFLMFSFLKDEKPASKDNKLMKKLKQIGVVKVPASTLFPNQLTDYSRDEVSLEVDEQVSMDFSIHSIFKSLVEDFEKLVDNKENSAKRLKSEETDKSDDDSEESEDSEDEDEDDE